MLKVNGPCSHTLLHFNFLYFSLPFIKAGAADHESSLTGIKRAHDHQHKGAKRPRCGDCTIGSQPKFDLPGQRKAPFLFASNALHSKENAENLGTGHPAHGLSGCQGFENEPGSSTGDDERYVLNVSPVDFLALLELSGSSKCCGSHANYVL
jgi:hypothetical protein